VQLAERDLDVLRALARFRIARTKDLISLVFPGIRLDTAAARMRRLFDAQFLDVASGDRSAESVYSLGSAGKTVLDAQGVDYGRRPTQKVEHHLVIVRTWVQLIVALRAMPSLRIELIRSDWELRAEFGDGALLVPDLLVQLAATASEPVRIRLAVEVDRGTERHEALRAKLESYQTAVAGTGLFGWHDVGLALVLSGAGARRQAGVERLVNECWSGWWVLWTDTDGPRNTLESLVAALHGARDDAPYDSPYGKGSTAAVSGEGNGESQREGSGLSQ